MCTYQTRRRGALLAVCGWLLAAQAALAMPITYNFDTFADGTALTGQYAGLGFAHATVLQAGIGLNEISFPPRSGAGVLYDDGGPIVITFAAGASAVSGYFTYIDGLTLSAYDSSDRLIASATAAWLSNVGDDGGDAGSAPNELLSVTASGDLIARIVISSAAAGGSLVLDDLTVDTAAVAVPAPGTLPLVMTGLLALAWRARRRRR
ncbi:PEP-CTERM sorting domain-containing protein [Pseudoduganella armeniaca]|uniref:Ice-binding protein C-terminal domain-containing protein n=1 Tax=Pseudoduganella armeniaca TaxID=2072590 RepID=A0A2R4CD49_9BURK|nr:PEP-CTERM sorting domain-containing protein [Pseudoduganella armeniaca]AVR97492.1 hypothetical protein C9I28_18960 [Pseudoduganella armeniaca]